MGLILAAPAQSKSSDRRRLSLVWILGLGLLAVDVAFIQLYRSYPEPTGKFALGNEASYPEIYQHLKELAIVLVAAVYLRRRREPIYFCWLGLFLYLFLDDTFQLHERLGDWLSVQLPMGESFGFRRDHLGELIVSAAAGVLFFTFLAVAWRRSSTSGRQLSRVLASLLLTLAFFGVMMDALHGLVTGPWKHRIGLLEDGGEMLTITAILWLLLAWRPPASESPK